MRCDLKASPGSRMTPNTSEMREFFVLINTAHYFVNQSIGIAR